MGSTIRVVGDSFGADGEFDFHIDTLDIGSFTTDENGGFVTTMKIPGDIEPGRIVFAVTDEEGQESEISIRIGVAETRKPIKTDIGFDSGWNPARCAQGNIFGSVRHRNPRGCHNIRDEHPRRHNNKLQNGRDQFKWQLEHRRVHHSAAECAVWQIQHNGYRRAG